MSIHARRGKHDNTQKGFAMGITSLLAVPEDIKSLNHITARDFQDVNSGLYAPENAAIDWRSLLTNYYERLGVNHVVDETEAVAIRDAIFHLAMIAATIELEGNVLRLCRKQSLTHANFPVRIVDGVRHPGELGRSSLWLVHHLMYDEAGLGIPGKRVILARYKNELPDYGGSASMLLMACVICLIEDTLTTSGVSELTA